MHISTPCSISGKHGMGAEAGWGRPDGRCRRTGGICFGTESVPETGIKLQEQAEKPLPWGSFCPKSPPPPPLTKNINNKRPCFPCLLGGGERELSGLEKCCFRWPKPSRVWRQNRKPKETSPMPGLAPGSSHRQDKPHQQDLHQDCGFSQVFWEWHNPKELG